MKIYTLLIMSLLFVLTSCFKNVEFAGIELESKLFFQCLPGAQDTTVFWVRSTFPVNSGLSSKPVKNLKIWFSVNGRNVDVFKNEGKSSSFPAEAFFSIEPLNSGDRLEFRAEATGFDPIKATTIIPEELQEVNITSTIIPAPDSKYYAAHLGRGMSEELSDEVTEFSISFKDNPRTKDYYIVKIIEYHTHIHVDGSSSTYDKSVAYILPKENVDSPMAPQDNDLLLISHESPWNTVNDYYGKNHLSMIFDDTAFEGELQQMKIMVNRLFAIPAVQLKYEVSICRVSQEYYKYVQAWHNAQKAEQAELPSSSPFMAYDNIDGGSGIFAGTRAYSIQQIP